MGLFRRKGDFSDFIVCPRCGIKSYRGIDSCPECGLVFSRLEVATNKEAKAKKLRGDRDFIINTTKLPNDVSFLKLLLFSIFLGPFGVHCFYVGRYLRGSIILSDFVAIVLAVVFNSYLVDIDDGKFIAAISVIMGLIMFTWFYDIIMIVIKKFKVPVAIDIEGEIQKQKSEYMESLKELEVASEEKVEEKVDTIVEEKTETKDNKNKKERNTKKKDK